MCHPVALAIYILKYLKAKEELWELKYFTMHKYNLQKSSQRNQNPSKNYNYIVKDVVVVFIHSSHHPSMDGILQEKKTLAEINNPPLCACVTVYERHARPQGGAPPKF